MSLKNAKRKFRVTYDSKNDEVFTVHNTNFQFVHFDIHKVRLHCHNTNNLNVTLFQTVSENELGYNKTLINNTKLERELYAEVGHLSHNYFKNLI